MSWEAFAIMGNVENYERACGIYALAALRAEPGEFATWVLPCWGG